ncbi:hypothetical protein Pan161_12570 [Gimesia algae]|uniref:DNA alkylation repair enzyme n=2 Tax=Gimesia algae TaxID=2527971 RepID=A0A517V9E3_9PLAN|nr:hypothetical protein Pan161_12570 [Gimesia algae]
MVEIRRLLENQQKWTVEELQSLYDRVSEEPGFCSVLVSLLSDSVRQQVASWLLKHALEAGQVVAPTDLSPFYRSLPELQNWETQLHLLQCLPYLTINRRDVKQLEPFLRRCLQSENKFVRAWSYNGFNELALQHARFQPEVDSLLAAALEEEAPAVKARVRNILKQRLSHGS